MIVLLSLLSLAAPLKVGVTLHPYYSWTKSVVGDAAVEVRAILPAEVDAGSYQPTPDDIKKLADLDALVINGLGHDDFIKDMVKASGNTKLVWIRPNDNLPLLKVVNGSALNAHSFISFSNAVQQTYAIEKALTRLRPELGPTFHQNAVAYSKRLRELMRSGSAELSKAKTRRVVTVHDGYAYLMQELGIEIVGVVEPAHGLVPSAVELATMVELLKKERLKIVFSEESFPEPLLQVLRESAGAKVYLISHVAAGTYSADEFEKVMAKNLASIVQALVKDP